MERILHVIGSLDNGGSQAMVMNIYKRIDRNKFQFDFVIDRKDELFFADDIDKLGGKIFVCPRFELFSILNYLMWWDAFFKAHPEYRIIHGHVRSTAAIYLQIAKRFGKVTIAHSHSISSGNGLNAVVKNILQFPIRFIADYFLACSDDAGKWLFGEEIVKSEYYQVINNAIDLDRFSYNQTKRQEIRNKLNITENTLVLGNVARLYEPKNYPYLISVFADIKKIRPDVKLLIVGDGPQKCFLVDMVSRLGLEKDTYFVGARKDVDKYLCAMDVFLMPSLYEGFGMSLIEAQATGIKCIASDKIPKSTKLTNNVIYLPINHEYISNWTQKILEYDFFKRRSMASEIKKHGFDIQDNVIKMENIYSTINRRQR